MKRVALLVALLLSFQVVKAATTLYDIEFSDGRKCKQCTFELKQGFVVSIKDNSGQEWLDPAKPMSLMVYKSGVLSWTAKNYTSPAGAPTSKEQADNNFSSYWQKRYSELSNEIDLCGSSTGDKSMCLLQVKQMEAQKDQALIQNQLQAQQVNATQAQTNIIRSQAILQSITTGAAKPQPTQPTHTNCYALGNQLNCNSY